VSIIVVILSCKKYMAKTIQEQEHHDHKTYLDRRKKSYMAIDRKPEQDRSGGDTRLFLASLKNTV
jgi:hypothetical protein